MGSLELHVPGSLTRFASGFHCKHIRGEFLGSRCEQRPVIVKAELKRVRCSARHILTFSELPLQQNRSAVERTKHAARDFFRTVHCCLSASKKQFPLAGKNKCFGAAVVPRTNLVLIAVSQDRVPEKDVKLRKQLAELITEVNTLMDRWVFELVCVPTREEYLILRTLRMRSPRCSTAEEINPHTRCIEVALMVALCKAGRFKRFKPEEVGIMAFGGTLWTDKNGNTAVKGFAGAARNRKYCKQQPFVFRLLNNVPACLDIWEPCGQHCSIYYEDMLAISAAGGPATNFTEPRSQLFFEINNKR